jgi:hypothetical protein
MIGAWPGRRPIKGYPRNTLLSSIVKYGKQLKFWETQGGVGGHPQIPPVCPKIWDRPSFTAKLSESKEAYLYYEKVAEGSVVKPDR